MGRQCLPVGGNLFQARLPGGLFEDSLDHKPRNFGPTSNGPLIERRIVLDLAGAIWFRPGSVWHRLARPLIALNYRNTLFKWKVLLTPDALSERERVSLRRFRKLQRLWLFNLLR